MAFDAKRTSGPNKVDSCAVLAQVNAKTATLFVLVDGKSFQDAITKKQLVRLLRSGAEALARMEGDDF